MTKIKTKKNLKTGLSIAEAAKLCNYVHFHGGRKPTFKAQSAKASNNPSLDFMEPIDEDIPKGKF